MSDNPRRENGIVTLRMSRKRALEFGLLVCGTCGYKPNNHFADGRCAHDSTCRGYVEAARYGVKIIKRKR